MMAKCARNTKGRQRGIEGLGPRVGDGSLKGAQGTQGWAQRALTDRDMVPDRLTQLCWLHNIVGHDDLGNPGLGRIRQPSEVQESLRSVRTNYAASPT